MKRWLFLTLTLSACGSQGRLQYDYGRSFTDAFNAQADLTRPASETATFSLSGQEAQEMRMNVLKESSDKEKAIF